jgi:hypothetical protein
MRKTILKQSQTLHRFAKPSFIEGMARVLDLGSTMRIYNESPSPNQADIDAIRHDWQVVGEDIENSINIYEQRQPTNI